MKWLVVACLLTACHCRRLSAAARHSHISAHANVVNLSVATEARRRLETARVVTKAKPWSRFPKHLLTLGSAVAFAPLIPRLYTFASAPRVGRSIATESSGGSASSLPAAFRQGSIPATRTLDSRNLRPRGLVGMHAVQGESSEDEGRQTFEEAETLLGIPRTAGAVGGRLLPSVSVMLEDKGAGIKGRWKEVGGNFVIYPAAIRSTPPRGVIHFMGGAFVGAAPHLTYRYLLEALCNEGYIVVTTPYQLRFDYLETIDSVLSRFDQVGAELAAEFGALPVIGVGHSCGALLHTLITTLRPSPRAANVLISYNNKPTKEAIPSFEELVVPISEELAGTEKSATDLPRGLATARGVVDDVLGILSTSFFSPRVVKREVVPALRQGLEVVDQIPDLLQSIASGTREFTPSPEETRDAVSRDYRARRTLLIRFDNDNIDETGEAAAILREAANDMEGATVDLKDLRGSHISPLTQNVILDPPELKVDGRALPDPLTPLRQGARDNFLRTINQVKTEIVDWLSAQSM